MDQARDGTDRPLGLVLAGGRSLRFGREKALVEIEGRPMIARVLDVLAPRCAAVAINAPSGTGAAAFAEAQGLPLASDVEGDPEGPLAGIRAGLAWAREQGAAWLVTAPCDTPRLPHDYVERLLEAGAPAVAETADGGHWLCALWSVAFLPWLEERLDRGEHGRVQDALSAAGARPVCFEEAGAFANVNRAEDLGRAPGPQV